MGFISGNKTGNDRILMWEYFVFHKDDAEKKRRLRTVQKLTTKEIKEKMVRNGLFDREVIKELRVTRIFP